jgi:hypothetical protein
MNNHFSPVCLPEKQRVLLYFGVVLECDGPILEAVFYTSFANTTMTSNAIAVWDSMANLMIGYLFHKISNRIDDNFPWDGILTFIWQLKKGTITIARGNVGHSVQITIDPEYRLLFPYPLPYFTIHFFGHVLYSMEQHAFLHIPFNQFDSFVDFHIDRLVKLLE